MFTDITRTLKIVNDLEISIEEFSFIYMIQIHNTEKKLSPSNKFSSLFKEYYTLNKNNFLYPIMLKRLEEKGLIINLNKSDSTIIEFNKIGITEAFKNSLIVDIDECWKEVLDSYPKFMRVNNVRYMTTSSDKDLKSLYFNEIIKKGSRYLHEEFITLTRGFYQTEPQDNPMNKIETSKEGAVKLEKWLMSWENNKDAIKAEMGIYSNPNQLDIQW
jgi:hypothetical protein